MIRMEGTKYAKIRERIEAERKIQAEIDAGRVDRDKMIKYLYDTTIEMMNILDQETQYKFWGKAMDTYTIEDLSKKLGMTLRGVRELITKGDLKATKIGRRYIVIGPELERFLKPPEQAPGKPGPDFLTVTEFSERTGIPEPKVRQWLREKIIKGAKDGLQWYVDPDMLRWWQEIRTGMKPKKTQKP